MERGLIHIYCGEGKGKTSAAVGLAVRAGGAGCRVLFVRFLKNENSGELKILRQIPNIHVMEQDRSFGFFKTLGPEEKKEAEQMYRQIWRRVLEMVQNGSYDVLVLDEFMASYNYGIIPREEALCFLRQKPEGLEVVLTGRNPAEELVELADYVSEIRKRKHPFDHGIAARKGIEY